MRRLDKLSTCELSLPLPNFSEPPTPVLPLWMSHRSPAQAVGASRGRRNSIDWCSGIWDLCKGGGGEVGGGF